MKRVQLWTAACVRGKIGAWAAILILEGLGKDDQGELVQPGKVLSGRHPNTTIEGMWMSAIVNGLSALRQKCIVDLYAAPVLANSTIKELMRQHQVRRHKPEGYWASVAMGIAEESCEAKRWQ